jgi:hypothetical protein
MFFMLMVGSWISGSTSQGAVVDVFYIDGGHSRIFGTTS